MLSCKPLSFLSVNAFSIANNWTVREGEANSLYFMLYDNALKLRQIFNTATITVKFLSKEHGVLISKVAIPVSSLDASLFRVDILATDEIASGNVYFEAVLDGVARKWVLGNGIAVLKSGVNDSVC